MLSTKRHHKTSVFAAGIALSVTLILDYPSALAVHQAKEAASGIELLHEKGRQAIRTFLDKKQEKKQRLDALRKAVHLDREGFEAVFRIFEDRDEDDDIRWEAFHRHPLNETSIAAAINVLRDVKNGSAALHAKLISDLGGRARLHHHSKAFQDILQTVRGLLTDQREEIRRAAFRLLTPMQDPSALELVNEGLRDPAKSLIPISDAIELLHVAGAAKHAAVIRPYLDHPDIIVRAKAALAMAIDPESRPKIIQLVKDRHESSEVRLAALRGLSGSDKTFPGYALEIIQDRNEETDVRKEAINRLVGFMNYDAVAKRRQVEFVEVLRRMAAEEAGPGSLGDLAKQVSSYMQKNFSIGPE